MFKKMDLEKIRKELMARKIQLEDELERLSSEKMSDTQSQDDGDQVVSVTMESLRNALQDTEYQEYRMLVAALKSIDAGTYGICQECGEEISEKRLKYNPNAQRCLPCQEREEELESLSK